MSTTRTIPPLNALRAFEAAARTGSFKEAGRELHVSQSAISHQIRHLEQALKVSLFERGGRAIALTEAGRTLQPFLQQAFDAISDGAKLLTQRSREDVLTVRMYSTFAVRWLVSRLHRFQSRHPELKLRLMTSQVDPVFPDQDCDLAVVIGRGARGSVHYEYLFSPTLFPVCSPRLIADGRRPAATAAERSGGVHHPAGLSIGRRLGLLDPGERCQGHRSRRGTAFRQLRSRPAHGGAWSGRGARHATLCR